LQRSGNPDSVQKEDVMFRATSKLVAALALVAPSALYAQMAHKDKPAESAASKPMSAAQKIREATSAAPAQISRKATIMDFPDTPGGQPKQLRAGTNAWVCFPSSPSAYEGASGQDPMCLDKVWQAWAEAWMSKKDPKISATGIAYMLRGDKGASNTDPFATAPAPDNEWVVTPPHIMVLFPDLKALDAYPTDPKSGGPWVMWKGTPYAHLMVPVSPKQAATMPSKPAAKPSK
jgi:hypothetical protein